MYRRLAVLCVCLLLTLQAASPAVATEGTVTWYDLSGNYTASGDILGYYDITCASPLNYDGTPVYELGTLLAVTDKETGASVVCEVTDTGDMALYGYALDLNVGTLIALGLDPAQGVYDVRIEVVGFDDGYY